MAKLGKIETDYETNIFKCFFFFDVKNYVQIKGNRKLIVYLDEKTL